MEFYRVSKKDLKTISKSASAVSRLTGKSFLYHWIDCMCCIVCHGCSPTQYLEGGFYKLRSFDRSKTYTKKRIHKVRAKFNDRNFEFILREKDKFNAHFNEFLRRKWICCKTSTPADIFSFLEDVDHIIVKPLSSSRGQGIYELEKTSNNNELASFYSGTDTLLEEIVVQHPLMCFNNKSVNTLRINTILDSKGEVHLIQTSLRCGVGESIVDNFCSGGVVYPVDSEYGRIEGPGGHSSLGQKVCVHPGSDIYMIGREIPLWEDVVSFINNVARALPEVRFVGWDVAIAQDGPVLIEGNHAPGAQLIEYQGIKRGLYKEMMSYS